MPEIAKAAPILSKVRSGLNTVEIIAWVVLSYLLAINLLDLLRKHKGILLGAQPFLFLCMII
jgi:hypothetical protein